MKLAYIGLVALALSGCATRAERENTRMETAMKQSGDVIQQCQAKLNASDAYGVMGRRLFSPDREVSLADKASRALATDAEIAAIYAAHGEEQSCRRLRLQSVGDVSPAFVPVLAEWYAAQDQNLVRLVRRQLNWGAYYAADEEQRRKARAGMLAAKAQIDARLAASQEAEMQRRQRAAIFFQQWSFQQQLLNEVRRTRVTNCQYVGSSISCTTS